MPPIEEVCEKAVADGVYPGVVLLAKDKSGMLLRSAIWSTIDTKQANSTMAKPLANRPCKLVQKTCNSTLSS